MKALKWTGIIVGVIAGILFIASLAGVWKVYKNPTIVNEPNLKRGSIFFTSRFAAIDRFKFVCFRTPEDDQLYLYRLCGMPGDKLEIKDGDLYINNKSVDEELNPANEYRVSTSDYQLLYRTLVEIDEESLMYNPYADSMPLFLSKKEVQEKNIRARRITLTSSYEDPAIKEKFQQNWNQDHFGPVTVPPGKYFVLGDNRHNAEDSRYRGFIDRADIKATVLWK